MAKRVRSKSVAPAEELVEDKVEKLNLKQLLRDDRTRKTVGILFLLFTLFLFVAFSSYLFTWDVDQSSVLSEGTKMLWLSDVHVSNLMGTFGAYISHFFIYKGFGIASFLLCTFLFVVGVNILFNKKVFRIFRNIKYLLIGLPVISITSSVFFGKSSFPWGGAVGDLCKESMYGYMGYVGTIGLICISFIGYVIWRFNPSFSRLTAKHAAINEDILSTEEPKLIIETPAESNEGNFLKTPIKDFEDEQEVIEDEEDEQDRATETPEEDKQSAG